MNNNESFELEEMRQQMAVLKKKLEQQEIINERMASKTRESIEKNMRRYYMAYKWSWIMVLLMLPLCYWALVSRLGFSIPFFIFGYLFMVPISTYFSFRGDARFGDKNLLGGNLVEVQKILIMAKKLHGQWFKYGLILNIVFPIWLIWEVYQKCLVGDFHRIHVMLVICVLCGFGMFLWGYFKRQRHYQEMLDQIDELTSNVE